MAQFSWNNISFSISKNTFQKLSEITNSFKVKKTSDNTSNTVNISGNDLQTYTIPFSTYGQDALELYKLWKSQLGQIAPILIEGSLFGPDNVMLQKVSLQTDMITNRGEIVNGTITLSFEESETQGKNFKSKALPYVSPIKRQHYKDAPEAVEDLILKIFYNDTDITDAVDVNSCIHDMYACSKADTLDIKFNDTNKVWDGWKPQKGDLISVKCGIANTGKMFITSVIPFNGLMNIKASSIPLTAKTRTNKSWENVHILQLAKEIADRHGLGFESYGVEDYLYSYVRQENEQDFVFLQKRCDLESLAFVVFDKKLILYSENYLEGQKSAEQVDLYDDADFTYTDNALQGYGSIRIKNGDLVGAYSSKNGLARLLEKEIATYMGGQDEANRFAKGILRQENKKLAYGYWTDTLRRELSAGSILDLVTKGTQTWNGKVFVDHIRQNYVDAQSKIFFRKTDID